MKVRFALFAALLIVPPAAAHLKMPKEPATLIVKRSPGSPAGVLYYCGYSHIDFNWLWDWPDTTKTWSGTAQTQLNLMYRFPGFHFGETQASAYLAMERMDPKVFQDIKAKVANGQWELLGGMWDESDEDIPSGEALARSFIYGQGYFKEKFGKQAEVGFLPDTFGHTRQLPQILREAEIQNFFFARCPVRGPDVNLFWWQGPDQSRVLAYSPFSPGWYNNTVDPANQTNYPATIKAQSGVNMALVALGTGDHGGGPAISDLTALEMLKTDPTFPEVREAQFLDFYNAVRAAEPSTGFPSVNRDLQYTFEGCYTTHGDMKRIVRDSENEMYVAETLASLASINGGDYPYDDLRFGWRHVAFNQFHDIAPGTAIHSTYEEAANKQKLMKLITDKHIGNAWSVLEKHVDTTGDGKPFTLFNPVAWTRSDPIEVTMPFDADTPFVAVTDPQGVRQAAQIIGREARDGKVFITFTFVANSMPSLGYRVYHVAPAAADMTLNDPITVTVNGTTQVVTTPQFIVNIDGPTGQVSRLYDRINNKEVLATGQKAFRLVVLGENSGNSAWSISLNGTTTYLDTATNFKVLETGPVRAHFQATYPNGTSTYVQDIFIYRGVPRVDARINADFNDYNLLLKSIIPTSLTSPIATMDGPFYAIQRPTDGHVDIPMQKWMDESQGTTYGVSVLNDCKYGADVNGSTMRISLLRGTSNPDTVGDKGKHLINYSVYPHSGDWKLGDTMRRGYQFNLGLRQMPCTVHTGDWGAEKSMLSTDLPNAIITAFKRAEDGSGYILRYYEDHGQTLNGQVSFPKPLTTAVPTNILEHQQVGSITVTGNLANVTTRPYGIGTIRVGF
ncbi:MAG TPA: glycoside hydrolase family 38 C-terminal domain-containing protein [Armatimonadota bacterium]|jgi:alpha-mannosidase